MMKILSLAIILIASTGIFAISYQNDIGGFYLPTKKIQAAAFKDLKHIAVDPTVETSRKVSGFLVTSNGNFQFEDAWFDANEKVFGFQTQKVKGVRYVYSGTFQNFDFIEAGLAESVMQGKLLKFVNGKSAGELDLSFDYTAGD